MKKIKPSFLLSVLMVVVSCSPNNSNQSVDETQIKKEVNQTFNDYVNHVNTNGLKGADKYFSTDDDFYWVEDGQIQYPNWDSLAAGIQQFHPQVDSVNMQVFESNIDVINQNYATLFARYKEDLTLKSGYAFTLDGAMTILLRKENDGWKFFNGHSSIKKPRGGN